jgi:hypothetical protein
MTRSILIAVALCAPAIAIADDAEPARDRGLTRYAIGLAFDVSDVDLGSARATAMGGALCGAIGGGRFQLTADAAFGRMRRQIDGERIGFYARGTIGARVLMATLSSQGYMFNDLVLDAGIGIVDYLLDDGVAIHKPIAYAGWGLRMGYRERKGHGGGMMFDLRLAASPRIDDPAVERLVCNGTCMSPDAAAYDVTLVMMAGVTAW